MKEKGAPMMQRGVALIIGLVLLAACGGGADGPNDVSGGRGPSTSGGIPQSYEPLADDACRAVRNAAENALDTSFTARQGPFTDYVTGVSGRACLLQASGTGEEFRSVSSILDTLHDTIDDLGWQEYSLYHAENPYGASRGFTQDDQLLLLSVGVRAAEGVDCPRDQTIEECGLAPEQQRYTITLQGVEGS